LIKREPDLDREPARFGKIGNADAVCLVVEPKRSELKTISLGVKAEAVGRRQPGTAQCGKIRRLGPEPLGVHGLRIVEGNQEVHAVLRVGWAKARSAVPTWRSHQTWWARDLRFASAA